MTIVTLVSGCGNAYPVAFNLVFEARSQAVPRSDGLSVLG